MEFDHDGSKRYTTDVLACEWCMDFGIDDSSSSGRIQALSISFSLSFSLYLWYQCSMFDANNSIEITLSTEFDFFFSVDILERSRTHSQNHQYQLFGVREAPFTPMTVLVKWDGWTTRHNHKNKIVMAFFSLVCCCCCYFCCNWRVKKLDVIIKKYTSKNTESNVLYWILIDSERIKEIFQ